MTTQKTLTKKPCASKCKKNRLHILENEIVTCPVREKVKYFFYEITITNFVFIFLYSSLIVFITALLCSCTVSVTTIHTQGEAADVVDQTQKASPTVSPNIDIPISGV